MPAIKVTVLRWPFGLAEISVSVHQLLEPGPVVLLTTADVAAPLIADCFANVECWAIDTRLVVVVAAGASDREQVSLTERSTAVRALRFCKLRRKRPPSANSHYSASAYATIRKVVAAWWRNRRRAIQQYIDYIAIFMNW